MGAFETFVNANLGIRKPLITDVGPASGSLKAAGIVGSHYIDSDTNFIYEKTGENNAEDWVKIRKLGDSLTNISSEISEELSNDLSVISGNLHLTGQYLEEEIDELSSQLSNVSSVSVQIPSGQNDLYIKYQDFGLSDYTTKPNVVVGLTYDSSVAPVNLYSYALYNVTTSGFNVCFSSDIEDDNLSLDFFVNGSPLSGQYQGAGDGGQDQSTEGGGQDSSTLNAYQDTSGNILARTSDPQGTIFYGTDSDALYIYDGSGWQIYNSN